MEMQRAAQLQRKQALYPKLRDIQQRLRALLFHQVVSHGFFFLTPFQFQSTQIHLCLNPPKKSERPGRVHEPHVSV